MATKKQENITLPSDVLEQTEVANLDLKKTTGCKIDDSVVLNVKSTFFGELIYTNKRTGDTTKWSHAGEVQPLSMGDLRAMKATQIDFFKNQWVVILGVADGYDCEATCADIYRALLITKFYENYIEPTDVGTICSWKSDEIAQRVSMMSSGAQENLIVILNECIKNGKLDSLKTIRAFEDAIGCRLRDPRDEE